MPKTKESNNLLVILTEKMQIFHAEDFARNFE